MGNNVAEGWGRRRAMDQARSHCPVATYEGKVYVFGGGAESFRSLNAVGIYDPDSDTWSSGCDMPTLRSGAVAVTCEDRVYIMGGGFKQADGTFRFLRAVEIYHPKTDSWEAGPDLIMPHDYPATAFLDGYIYVLGGHHPDATLGGPKTDPGFDFCERLNLATGEWEEIAPLPTARFALSAVTLDGKVLALGGVAFTPQGFNNFDHIEAFDPVKCEWYTDSSITLPWPAAGHGSCMLNGLLYLFGGYSGDAICARASVYDPAGGSWRELPSMPAPRAAMGVATLDSSICLFGGWADDGRTPLDTVVMYQSSI